MSLIPNVSSNTFTMSAIVVGLLLLDDTTPNEQDALGNWLMLVAQILCTDAYYKQVLEDRNKTDEKELLVKMRNALDKGIGNLGK